jgi:DNA-binding NarL/FixJ family response regulator
VSQIRVLLVDDYPSFLDSAARFLGAVSFVKVVGCATSGAEALAQVEQLRPDLVMMDIIMPGLNGLDATRCLKNRPHPPRVVLTSWHNSPDYQRAGFAAGADGFLSKSDFGERIAPIVHELFPESIGREQTEREKP